MRNSIVTDIDNRCRLVLIASPAGEIPVKPEAIAQALKGGDVASVILAGFHAPEDQFRAWCELVVPIIQSAGAAAVVVDDTQAAGRSKADGIHIKAEKKSLGEAIRRFQPKLIVGTETFDSRHDALELGEERPDLSLYRQNRWRYPSCRQPQGAGNGRMVGIDDRNPLHRHVRL